MTQGYPIFVIWPMTTLYVWYDSSLLYVCARHMSPHTRIYGALTRSLQKSPIHLHTSPTFQQKSPICLSAGYLQSELIAGYEERSRALHKRAIYIHLYIYTSTSARALHFNKRALYVCPQDFCGVSSSQGMRNAHALSTKEPYIHLRRSPIFQQKSPIFLSAEFLWSELIVGYEERSRALLCKIFCGYIGLICGYVGLVCGYIGLICGYIGLICGYIGLICGYVRLFCNCIRLFGGCVTNSSRKHTHTYTHTHTHTRARTRAQDLQ